MGVTGSFDHLAGYLLLAGLDVSDPFIGQDIIEAGAIFHAHLEHAANDISTLPRQKS